MDLIVGLLVVVLAFVVYLFPAYLARDKKNAQAIMALNIFLGWTVLGWIGALVWALSDAPKVYSSSRKCRFCAEPILWEAKVCRFCQRDQPQPEPVVMMPPVPVQAAPEPVVAPRPVLRDVSANTSRCEGCGANVPKYRAAQHVCAPVAKKVAT